MQRIELDNFRVFGSPAAFDLAPVTVLTGKNNSGKSSLIKAFLVLADYLEQDDQTVLRLDGARAIKHRINSWENLKNWKTLGLNNIQLSYVQEEFVFHYEFEEYTPSQGSLFRFRMLIKDTSEELTLTRAGYGNYTLAVTQKFINYVTANAVERVRLRDTRTYVTQLEQVTARLAQLNSMLDEADANTLQQFPLLLQEKQQLTNRKKELTDLLATEKVAAGLLFQAEVCVQELTSATLPGIIQGALVNYITDSEEKESEDEDYEGEEDDWEEIGNAAQREWEEREEDFKQYAESVKQQMKEQEEGVASIEQIQALLSSIDEEPEAYVRAEEPEIEVNKTAEEIEGEIASGAFTPIREMMRKYELSKEQERQLLIRFQQVIDQQMHFSLTHLGANRTYQARLFLPGQNGSEINAIAQVFLQSELYEDGEAHAFLRRWLSSEHGFGIGDAVTVEPIEGTAVRITLYREEREVNLADLGFGAGQILTVLLQLAALIQQREAHSAGDMEQRLLATSNRTPTLVLIEEPEANLHPRLQSKLAELFTEVAREYGLQFVLETHSEYLIRRLQRIIALGQCTSEEVALYYLDTDSRRRIHILPDGKLSESFGPGFFDEAGEETLALHRIQRKNLRS